MMEQISENLIQSLSTSVASCVERTPHLLTLYTVNSNMMFIRTSGITSVIGSITILNSAMPPHLPVGYRKDTAPP